MFNLYIFIILGILSGIISSIMNTGLIIAPGFIYLGGGMLGYLLLGVIFLYYLYNGQINIVEILVFIISYIIANYLANMFL